MKGLCHKWTKVYMNQSCQCDKCALKTESGEILKWSGKLFHKETTDGAKSKTDKDWDLLHQIHFCVVFARLLYSVGITKYGQMV